MSRLLAAPREVADKRGQVVGGRGAKATDDYTQCISTVCVSHFHKWCITYPYPYRVSCDLDINYHLTAD